MIDLPSNNIKKACSSQASLWEVSLSFLALITSLGRRYT